ncbi:hypothetical protein BTW08_15400 [Salinicola sp. MH3R3-1]|uniref:phage tail terminator protein n=1 Tax=Salinicola sp. MH3R3-1 TaxID=1928762 RepID=UPI00094E4295|nr:hypothetical protein [Salinicola sp. MH3R3-1]OLO06876.1 hypothetical protein BTW08_15400 [Salinicola sp. MH3R3-1]
MLSLEPWLERLNAAELGVQASLAADIKAAQQVRANPSLSLVNGRDRVTHQERHPHTRHKVTTEVMVVTGVARYGSARFGNAADQLAAMRQPVLSQLIYWQPPSADLPIRWNGGQLLALTDSALFWVDVVSTDYWWADQSQETNP